MAVVEQTLPVEAAQVRAALADGWSYADWVVGAVHVRAVDGGWPSPGAAVHHRLGGWPLTFDDVTKVAAWDAGGATDGSGGIELRANLRPFGKAAIRLTWRPVADGCHVTMAEEFVAGAGRLARNPVGQAVLRARNTECLRRLGDLAHRY